MVCLLCMASDTTEFFMYWLLCCIVQNAVPNVKLVLIANKLDAQEKRQVTTRQGTQVWYIDYLRDIMCIPTCMLCTYVHAHADTHTHTHKCRYLVLLCSLLKKMELNFLKLVLILQKIFQRSASQPAWNLLC